MTLSGKAKPGPGQRKTSIVENKYRNKWKIIRWTFLLSINFFFFASFYFDIQLLEGTLSGSRFFGFHLSDPFAALQTMLASRVFNVNLIIGMITVAVFYLLVGGRSFCSWICPYHFLSEIGDMIKKALKKRKILVFKQFTLDRRIRYYLYIVFLGIAALTGYSVFEVINPVAALSRAIVYGPEWILLFVGALLVFEILFSRRAWCRFLCPVGVSYSLLGRVAPTKIHWDIKKCVNCKDCQKVCMVPHVLKESVNQGKTSFIASGECTRCGLCVDACDDAALTFDIKNLDKFI